MDLQDTMSIANSSVLWFLAIAIVSNVIFQSVIFYRMAKKRVAETQLLDPTQVKKAFRIGAIGTIGPAFAVFAVAVALIAQVGGPITLYRIGIIGSAAFEMVAAQIGSAGTVGTADFTPQLLATAAWVMTLGGAGWLVMVFFSTKHIDRVSEKIKAANPLMIKYMSTFAPFIIFFTLGYNQVVNRGLLKEKMDFAPLGALIMGGVVVYVINRLVKQRPSLNWLKEWAMGFAVIGAMLVGSLLR